MGLVWTVRFRNKDGTEESNLGLEGIIPYVILCPGKSLRPVKIYYLSMEAWSMSKGILLKEKEDDKTGSGVDLEGVCGYQIGIESVEKDKVEILRKSGNTQSTRTSFAGLENEFCAAAVVGHFQFSFLEIFLCRMKDCAPDRILLYSKALAGTMFIEMIIVIGTCLKYCVNNMESHFSDCRAFWKNLRAFGRVYFKWEYELLSEKQR